MNIEEMIDIDGKFKIGKYLITNEQYSKFEPIEYLPEKANHPVVNVSWYQAMSFCAWLSKETGDIYSLPTEEQWCLAATGGDGWLYPWGNEFDKDKCNTWESGIRNTTAVGKYSPAGDSPYGCADMAGNVWEWCLDQHDKCRALRGGSWYDNQWLARASVRLISLPVNFFSIYGMRVVAL